MLYYSPMPMTTDACNTPRSPPWWVVLLAVVAAVLCAAHVRRYYRRGGNAAIVQTSLSELSPELLAGRRPIVIEDVLVRPSDLATSSAFRWQHVWRSSVEPCRADGGFEVATARFTLLFYDHDGGEAGVDGGGGVVVIEPPETGGANATAVRLVAGRAIVLPPRWRYSGVLGGPQEEGGVPPPRLMKVRLHDPVSAVLALNRPTAREAPSSP